MLASEITDSFSVKVSIGSSDSAPPPKKSDNRNIQPIWLTRPRQRMNTIYGLTLDNTVVTTIKTNIPSRIVRL
ncbi:hypothetical protein D3C80_2107980 [compost metagenome]